MIKIRNAPIDPKEKRAFHIKEASSVYGPSRSTLYNLMKDGTLPFVKIRSRRLIRKDDLEALIAGDK